MKLPKILGNKQNEQKEIDELILRGEEEAEEAEETAPSMEQPSRMGMEIQKLWAQVKTLREMMRMNDERFQRLSEGIGDVRQRSLALERNLSSLEMETRKAIDLVNAVQPQKLMGEVKKEDIKVMKLESRQESFKKFLDTLKEEVKGIKSSISAFRGTEAVIKLNNEVRRDLKNMKRIQAVVSRDSEKVEDIFVQVQKRYSRFLELSDEFKSLEKRFDEVMKKANHFMIESRDFVKKEDIESRLRSIVKLKDEFRKRREEFDREMNEIKSVIPRVERLEKTLENRVVEIDDAISRLVRMEQKNYVTEEVFDRELDNLFQRVMDKLERYRRGEE
ncbi:MAG: hypothetical protein B6U86_00145 [Candidatus Altiarchaeales archaeon ex4484_43]|nr:MAG: hypothetical protein B6U86_00145 [Candidatus Altiarchaeales archaeon ex4484_43]RLI89022.1 MAG: hypothetical protein DRO62_02530 [Candidatus Altiarchaeales archaeon]